MSIKMFALELKKKISGSVLVRINTNYTKLL